MPDCEVLSKGNCAFAFEEFSAQSYVIIREGGKKYLILKLKNNGEMPLTNLKFNLIQLDQSGKIIKEDKLRFKNLQISAGAEFVLNEKIPLKEGCQSFNLTEISGKPHKKGTAVSSGYAVAERAIKAPLLICIFAAVLIACIFTATWFQLKTFKENENIFLNNGVEYAFEGDDTSEGSNVYVTGYHGSRKSIVVPEEIEGHPVTLIAKSAFEAKTKITEITIKGAVEIEDKAFYYCKNLKTFNAPYVTVIGRYAFGNCSSLVSISAENLESIGECAFLECTSLKEINVKNSEKTLSLGKRAFAKCTALESVIIDCQIRCPSSLNIFEEDYNLTTLKLKNFPASSNGASGTVLALFGLSNSGGARLNLSTLIIDDLYGIPDYFCYRIPVRQVTVSNLASTAVGAYAFADSLLSELSLPAQITRVDVYAFYNTKISSFDGAALEYIGYSAFEKCKNLNDFSLKDNKVIGSIGSSAFCDCTSLTEFYIPKEIHVINDYMFSGCEALSKVQFESGSALQRVEHYAFKNCLALTDINLPQSITLISDGAFESCKSLTKIELYENLTILSDRAFCNCVSLKAVQVPQSVTEIGFSAFQNCESLEEITLPFVGGTLQDSVWGYSENTHFGYIFGASNAYDNTYYVPASLKTVTIKDATVIDGYAFQYCTYLENVYLPSNVTTIGDGAFRECQSLKSIIIPSGVNSIGYVAFENCFRLHEVWNLSGLNIEKGSYEYGGVARYAIKIYNSIYDQIPKIKQDGYTFAIADGEAYLTEYTKGKQNLSLPERVNDSGTIYSEYIIASGVFAQDSEISTMVIPEGVKAIGHYAFFKCDSLKSVSLPQTVESIGEYSFSLCSSLEEINFPSNLKTLGEYAFEYCYSIKRIELPEGLKQIPYGAFECCENLNYVLIPSTIENIGNYAFAECKKLYEVHNLSHLNITVGSTNHGFVAYYALKIYTSREGQILYAQEDECLFAKYDGEWHLCLIEKELFNSIYYFPKRFTYEGETVNSYIINKGSLDNCSFNSVLIPKSVTKIERDAFAMCRSLTTVYYEGTQSEWNAIKTLDFSVRAVYFYADCVHEFNEWTYTKDGTITRDQAGFEWTRAKNPTCTQTGLEIGICKNCGKSVESIVPATGHSFDENGKCTECGELEQAG